MANNEIKKQRKIHIKKDEKYHTEQIAIADKILQILDPVTNQIFDLHGLDNDQDKIKEINDLVPEIKKYCKVGRTVGIALHNPCKRPYLSIIKTMFKKVNWQLISKDYLKNIEDNKYVRTQRYIINKP